VHIFGRERELARLDSFLDSLLSGSAALLLEGEPGIGKTTVWRAGVDAAQARGYRVLSSRPAEADASLSYAGLADILRDADDDAFDELPEPQREAVEIALLRKAANGAPPDPRAVFAALTTILRALGGDRPTLVAIDDVQWLDGPSARALAFTGRRLDGSPVGALTSSRTEPAPAAATWFDRTEHVRLEPLTAAALHQLVKQRLGWSMPRPMLLRLHDLCHGNAFFAVEIARLLDAAGRPDAREAWPVPDDLRLLVDLRLGQLPETARRALLRAAAMSHPTTEAIAPSQLVGAEETGIITVGPFGRIRFAHPLFASAIYDAGAPAQRRELHAELALAEADPEERARHLGLATSEPDEKVAAELEGAADRAQSRGAPEIAAELQARASELTPPSSRGEAGRRALAAAASYVHAGALGRARGLLQGIINEAEHPFLRAPALRLLAFIRFREERYEEAVALLHASAATAGDHPDLRAPVELDLTMVALSVSLDHEVARPHANAALAYAERSADTVLLSQALAGKLVADFLLGEGIDEARMARALELEDPAAECAIELRPTLMAGFLALYSGDFDRARTLLYPLRDRLLERGEDTDLPLLSMHLAWLECWAGRLDAARTLAAEARQTAALGGTMTAHALAMSALLDAHAGDAEQCRERVTAARSAMGGAEFCLVVEWSSTALGLLEASLGDHDATLLALERLTDFFGSRGRVDPIHLVFLPDEIEALVGVGKLDRAEALTSLLAASGRAVDRPWAVAASGRCSALIRAAQNDLEDARTAVERALAEHERVPMPLELARTLLVKGQIERRSKHKAAARESLERALEICEEIGANLWAERARAELRRVGQRRDPDELTATEERVAALAASGLTNREVAAAAFMSQKTVEANLSRVYRKLGIRSRAELGLRLAERGSARAPVA
jgi:DNA-binding CsgD family transcriptional regulator